VIALYLCPLAAHCFVLLFIIWPVAIVCSLVSLFFLLLFILFACLVHTVCFMLFFLGPFEVDAHNTIFLSDLSLRCCPHLFTQFVFVTHFNVSWMSNCQLPWSFLPSGCNWLLTLCLIYGLSIFFVFVFISQVLCLVIIGLWIIACPFGSISFCIKLQQPFVIILGSLSVNDCSPRMFWAVINGESSFQTAVHVKGTLQVFLSHQIRARSAPKY